MDVCARKKVVSWEEGKKKVGIRTEQDSNLRGQSPLDFESNALTTRPSVQLLLYW